VLNKPAYRDAKILVAGDNFGCGSSREHAPWALLDFGIRCVISTSFADIFYNNCFKNGILPIVVTEDELDKLMDDAARRQRDALTIDLENQEIRGPDGGVITFEIDPFRKHCLMNGLDDIGLTMEKAPAIDIREGHRRNPSLGLIGRPDPIRFSRIERPVSRRAFFIVPSMPALREARRGLHAGLPDPSSAPQDPDPTSHRSGRPAPVCRGPAP
jgi:3-isopropylmalate dehydratase small subunit